jgi:hypothetical protein
MSIHGPINPPSDDDGWGGCSDSEDVPPGPAPFAEYDDNTPQPTVEALHDAVNAAARLAGYALGRSNGKKKKGTDIYKRYVFYCSRGGPERESTATLRNTTTSKTGCKYQCIARLTPEGWRWEQHCDPSKRVHNHPPVLDPSALPQHRKMASPVTSVIKSLSGNYAIKTREISNIIQTQFPGTHFTKKDIDNQRSYLRAEEIDGHSASGAIIKAFDEEGVTYEAFWKDPEVKDVLQGIVFTFPETEEVWERFGNCLGVDNTYRTNELGYPLMVVTTMTNINTVANVAFALMKDETRESFDTLFEGLEKLRARINAPKPHVIITDQDKWQKAALLEVWPDTQQQLCRFHMNANVALQSKKKWAASEEAAIEEEAGGEGEGDQQDQRQSGEA